MTMYYLSEQYTALIGGISIKCQDVLKIENGIYKCISRKYQEEHGWVYDTTTMFSWQYLEDDFTQCNSDQWFLMKEKLLQYIENA